METPSKKYFGKRSINGIQQIGIGTPDVNKTWAWYRKYFGIDIPIFSEVGEASLMTDYTGEKVHSRLATLAINIQGGGGFEFWQFTSRKTQLPNFKILLGDYGIFAVRVKSRDVIASYQQFQREGLNIISEVVKDPTGREYFFVKDLHGLIFQIVPGESWFSQVKELMGGTNGCIIGVSNLENSKSFYHLLGYDTVIYDRVGVFPDFQGLPGGNQKVRRVLLTHSEGRKGSLSRLFGSSKIELIEVFDRIPNQIYKDRYWGDLGFIHLCFDIQGISVFKQECAEQGFPFVVDSENSFDIGEASGRFSYVEDPDGTLIELVETYKIPILKKLGWYLDLRKWQPEKNLTNWILKALVFNRVSP